MNTKSFTTSVLFSSLCALGINTSYAGIYKCTSSAGRISYSAYPCATSAPKSTTSTVLNIPPTTTSTAPAPTTTSTAPAPTTTSTAPAPTTTSTAPAPTTAPISTAL